MPRGTLAAILIGHMTSTNERSMCACNLHGTHERPRTFHPSACGPLGRRSISLCFAMARGTNAPIHCVLFYFASPWAVSRPPPSTRLHDNIPTSCMHVTHMYNQHRLGRLRLKMALMEALTHRHGPRHHRRDPRDTCCACHIWRLEPFHALQMSCIADFMSRNDDDM